MIGSATVGVGAALATPFVVATAAFVKAGDALDKTGRRTGVSVEALSELQFAASQSRSVNCPCGHILLERVSAVSEIAGVPPGLEKMARHLAITP